jgi:hypothetical protein
MSGTHSSEYFGSSQRELLSERRQMVLLLLAVAFFSVSIAFALAFTNARVHRSPVTMQQWRDKQIERVINTTSARRPAGSYSTILSPSSPTTRA